MTDRGPWSLAGEELALVRYVRPAEVARHVQLPGRSGESRLARLRAVYATLAAKEIGYAYAAPGAEDGMQVIRPPEQVLWARWKRPPEELLDELHPAGAPIRVGAALREVDADVSGRPVWARLRPVGGGGRVDTQLSWNAAQGGFEGELPGQVPGGPPGGDASAAPAGGFEGELPGQVPGLYEIRVSAREVPGAGDLVATDTVAVVEGD